MTTIQDNLYLCWQAELLHWNCAELGRQLTILIGYRGTPSLYAVKLAEHCGAMLLEDTRSDMSYAPSIQPHLLAKVASPESGPVLLLDSDVLLKAIPAMPGAGQVIGSDCGAYLNAAYLDGCDADVLAGLCGIAGVPAEYVRSKTESPGAQYLLPSLFGQSFWERVEVDSNKMYAYLGTCKCSIHQVQVWTASMWAILYALYLKELAGELQVSTDPALDFCFACDPAPLMDRRTILHCAGVAGPTKGLFYKGDYTGATPFTADLSYVEPGTCSYLYAGEITRYKSQRKEGLQICH